MTQRQRKLTLRRVNRETLADTAEAIDVSELIEYSNANQWDAINDAVALLFYKETGDDVIFDPEGDAALLRMHENPYAFSNKRSLLTFEALIGRARYHCKPHPRAGEVAAQIAEELGESVRADELLVFVYKRDTAKSSTVQQRHRSPFRNTSNGIGGSGAPVVLFGQYTHDPFVSAGVVWQREVKVNSTVGVVAFRIETKYG